MRGTASPALLSDATDYVTFLVVKMTTVSHWILEEYQSYWEAELYRRYIIFTDLVFF